jgi:hypothetical protein
MIGALIFDVILMVVSFIRLVYYGPGGLTSLTSVYALIDMVILSLLIITFLIGIAAINTATTTDVLELLLRTKKEALSEKPKRGIGEGLWDIAYITATSEYLSENRPMYSITLFGLLIDNALVTQIALSMLAGIGSALLSVIQKDSNTSN